MKTFLRCLLAWLAWSAAVAVAAEGSVNASAFGFDPADATAALQRAIDSGARRVVVDRTDSPWVLAPVRLRSDLELIFADGTVVKALPGAYQGRGECMFSARKARNLTIRGIGKADLSMNKADYQDASRYSRSEWRHLIALHGCENVRIADLTLRNSGGDGIYLGAGSSHAPCRNVLVENVVSDGHHRQGMSVICAEKLLIRNCRFLNTVGTAPACGLDIEPNDPAEVILDTVIENCEFSGNDNCGLLIHLPAFRRASSIVVRNCRSFANTACGLSVYSLPELQSAGGTVRFENCRFFDNRDSAMILNNQHPQGQRISFVDCEFDNRRSKDPALLIFNNGQIPADVARIRFQRVTFRINHPDLLRFMGQPGFGVQDVSGDVRVVPDTGAPYLLDWAAFQEKHPPHRPSSAADR